MERKKASDFPPEVLKLFDGYVHGTLGRREFLYGAAWFEIGKTIQVGVTIPDCCVSNARI